MSAVLDGYWDHVRVCSVFESFLLSMCVVFWVFPNVYVYAFVRENSHRILVYCVPCAPLPTQLFSQSHKSRSTVKIKNTLYCSSVNVCL